MKKQKEKPKGKGRDAYTWIVAINAIACQMIYWGYFPYKTFEVPVTTDAFVRYCYI